MHVYCILIAAIGPIFTVQNVDDIMNVNLYERTLTYTIAIDDNYICQIYILVSVVYVTVRVHLVRFKLIANKTDEH